MSSVPTIPGSDSQIYQAVNKATAGLKNLWDKGKAAVSKAAPELEKYDFVKNEKDALEAHPNQAQDDKNKLALAKQPKIIEGGSYKSLADLQAHGYGTDKKAQQAQIARQLKDPFKAPTPGLRLNALAGKLDRVYATSQYQSLRPENQVKVKGLLYDKYVAPIMKQNGLQPPPKEEWLAGVNSEARKNAEKKPTATLAGTFGASYLSGAAMVTKLAGNVLHGVASYATTDKGKQTAEYKAYQRQVDKVLDFSNRVSNVSTDYTSTFATKTGAAAWTTNFAGRMIGEAPAYMLAGEILGPAYAGTAKAAEGIIPSLAEKGALSTGWNVIRNGFQAAGNVFSVDKGEGKTTHEATVDAAGAAILGAGLHASIGKLADAFDTGRDKLVDAMRFKANQLAAGGKPFTNLVVDEADKIMGETSEPKNEPKALTNGNDPDIKQAANNEAHLREQIARQFHPDKADEAGSKSVWRNLSKAQRAKVKAHIEALTGATAEMMPLVAPEVATQSNAVELVNEAKANPRFAARLQAVEKLTGLKAAEVLTKAQATEVAEKAKLTSPAKQFEEVGKEEDEYEPEEGASASLGVGYKVSHLRRNDNFLTPKLSSPNISAEDFINGTIKYLGDSPATKSGKIYYEHPAHHLLAVATDSDAPSSVKNKAFKFLENEYGESRAEATKHGAWLKNHVAELRDSGKLKTEGNVYRSTKLTQGRYRTKWQHELSLSDVPKSDMAFVKKLIAQKPELKPVFSKLFKQLAALKMKAATPETEAARRAITKKVAETLKEYK